MLDAHPHVSLQRAKGRAMAAFGGGDNRLRDLHQSGSLKALLPKNHAPVPDLVLVNTAGGLTGGDRYAVNVTAHDGASVTVATQTAERVYKASTGVAHMDVTLSVSGGGALHWLPQETILFDHSAIQRTITANVDESSRLLIVEPVVFGRQAMGETLTQTHFSDRWRIRQNGRLIHAEQTRISGDFAAYQGIGALNGARAVATILYVGPDAVDLLEAVRSYGIQASAWDGRMVIRLMDESPRNLRLQITDFMKKFRGCDLPRVWTM
ncbi:hypothetical protein BVC71_03670 [Marivivens niveibacter]|uniref:Urease accessory protein UreD n=1 Tax=Marivivens niveibacter TaxID=1930667 RepID=A0A251X202_9RHOB|nr:urease accessory protein UreD [Marivivens niveibacter]OUD10601.1 hypothetical protein BVC71_03670 [Marivivens niveibacter]